MDPKAFNALCKQYEDAIFGMLGQLHNKSKQPDLELQPYALPHLSAELLEECTPQQKWKLDHLQNTYLSLEDSFKTRSGSAMHVHMALFTLLKDLKKMLADAHGVLTSSGELGADTADKKLQAFQKAFTEIMHLYIQDQNMDALRHNLIVMMGDLISEREALQENLNAVSEAIEDASELPPQQPQIYEKSVLQGFMEAVNAFLKLVQDFFVNHFSPWSSKKTPEDESAQHQKAADHTATLRDLYPRDEDLKHDKELLEARGESTDSLDQKISQVANEIKAIEATQEFKEALHSEGSNKNQQDDNTDDFTP